MRLAFGGRRLGKARHPNAPYFVSWRTQHVPGGSFRGVSAMGSHGCEWPHDQICPQPENACPPTRTAVETVSERRNHHGVGPIRCDVSDVGPDQLMRLPLRLQLLDLWRSRCIKTELNLRGAGLRDDVESLVSSRRGERHAIEPQVAHVIGRHEFSVVPRHHWALPPPPPAGGCLAGTARWWDRLEEVLAGLRARPLGARMVAGRPANFLKVEGTEGEFDLGAAAVADGDAMPGNSPLARDQGVGRKQDMRVLVWLCDGKQQEP